MTNQASPQGLLSPGPSRRVSVYCSDGGQYTPKLSLSHAPSPHGTCLRQEYVHGLIWSCRGSPHFTGDFPQTSSPNVYDLALLGTGNTSCDTSAGPSSNPFVTSSKPSYYDGPHRSGLKYLEDNNLSIDGAAIRDAAQGQVKPAYTSSPLCDTFSETRSGAVDSSSASDNYFDYGHEMLPVATEDSAEALPVSPWRPMHDSSDELDFLSSFNANFDIDFGGLMLDWVDYPFVMTELPAPIAFGRLPPLASVVASNTLAFDWTPRSQSTSPQPTSDSQSLRSLSGEEEIPRRINLSQQQTLEWQCTLCPRKFRRESQLR